MGAATFGPIDLGVSDLDAEPLGAVAVGADTFPTGDLRTIDLEQLPLERLIWGWVIWGLQAVTKRLVLIITGYQHQDDLMHYSERAGSASISLSYPGKPSDELAQQML